MKNIIIGIVVVLIIGAGFYFISKSKSDVNLVDTSTTTPDTVATTTPNGEGTSIGKSVGGLDIMAYTFGSGSSVGAKKLLFVGGIHGGYEWNTALVAYQMVDYLKANPQAVAANLQVTVIPVLNPDGLNKTVGTTSKFLVSMVPTGKDATVPGRFNGNNVDLNRNFDCDWQTQAKWQNKTVSGGASAFSEPESLAIRNLVESNKPTAVVVWYSSAGGVYASNCHSGVLPETKLLTEKFATASGYPAHDNFDFYEITGDMVNWLAKQNIPAISVLLTNHTDTEWDKNQRGIDAVLKYYAE